MKTKKLQYANGYNVTNSLGWCPSGMDCFVSSPDNGMICVPGVIERCNGYFVDVLLDAKHPWCEEHGDNFVTLNIARNTDHRIDVILTSD